MRVAIVTAWPQDTGSPKGGVEAVSVVLVRALVRQGLTVDVITCAAVPKLEVTASNGFTVHRLPRIGRSMLSSATGPDRKQVSDYLLKLRPDVVHAHDTYGLMVQDLPLPRVFTVHGFIYGDTLLSGQRFPWLRSKIWERVEKRGWSKQPHIISISPYVRERLHGIATGTIHDIDNAIDENLFGIPYTPTPSIFSAAVISPRKNTLTLVRAFARIAKDIPAAQLRLAGSITNEHYGNQLQREIQSLGLVDRAHLLGKIPTAEIRQELSRASIFALVSLEENSPLGIEEAMAVGVPVITSNRCGMPYMVKHSESGYLVDPFNVEQIAERMRTLLTDPVIAKRMSERSIHIARERFHPDVVAARTLAVYEEALAHKANRAQGAAV